MHYMESKLFRVGYSKNIIQDRQFQRIVELKHWNIDIYFYYECIPNSRTNI